MNDISYTQDLLNKAGFWIDGVDAFERGDSGPGGSDTSAYAQGYRHAQHNARMKACQKERVS